MSNPFYTHMYCCITWYGFSVRSMWHRVLWQADTLWLVNRRMTARQGSQVQQMCNRKETTEGVRFRQSPENRKRSEGHPADKRRFGSLWRHSLQGCVWVQVLAPTGLKKKMRDNKKTPFWVYVSPSISQTNNKLWALFENKRKDIFLQRIVSFDHWIA